MPIKVTTIKRLFVKSKNQCALPNCFSGLVIGETIVAEICHIRARRAAGPRYDASLTESEKNEAPNLILLCPTCHKLVDKDKAGKYSVKYLEAIKAQHERDGGIELSPAVAQQALAILEQHKLAKPGKSHKGHIAHSTVGRTGVAVSIGGNNSGPIDIRFHGRAKTVGAKYPHNSIGSDASMSGYMDYLCDLYVSYMSVTRESESTLRGKVGRALKNKFRLKSRTRYHIPVERFWEVVAFLQEKLGSTPVGRKHLSLSTKLCSTFDEWRSTTR